MREIALWNQHWKFSIGDDEERTVILPHSVALTPANSSGGRNYQGICRYARSISPQSLEGKKCFLRIDGAMGTARVLFRRELIAENFCGYIPFVIDMTEYVKQGGELEVMLDNRDNRDLPPGKEQDLLDFSYEGGLYRNIWLTTTNNIYITDSLLEHEVAGGGIFVHFSKVSKNSACMHTCVHVRNETGEKQEAIVRCFLMDTEGNIAARAENAIIIEDEEAEHVHLNAQIENPLLWSMESPNQYMLKTELLIDGTVADRVETTTGIRTFTMTYNHGVIYNGISYRISGGNYHQSWPIIGNAVPDTLLRRDAVKLREIGLKNIRSHYPLADAFTEECNRQGITLIVSNPGWQHYKEGIFAERLIENMRRIVRWQRNNPSILLWEPMPNETVVPMEIQQRLHDAVHEEYPFESCYTASDHGPTDVSYREYDPNMLQPGMEGYTPMKRYQGKEDNPLWIREYGDSPDNWHDQGCAWRTPRAWGDYAMLRAVERMLGQDAQMRGGSYLSAYNKPNICGFGIWPAIEHNRGYHINPCWGGFFDLFRLPKFTAWFMKSQQDIDEVGAVVFIANWWTEVSPKDVTVFSNAQSVRLYFNEILVEEREPESLAVPHAPFVFRDVYDRFRSRERCELRAYAMVDGQVVAVHTVKSPGVPCALHLDVDEAGVKVLAGGDILAVHCSVVDADGNLTPRSADGHPIFFQVEGAAVLLGDNGIGTNPVFPEAGIATILIQTKQMPGEITVSANMQWPQGNQRVWIHPIEYRLFSY